MRTKRSFINMVVGLGGQGIALILSFVSRMIFVQYLSAAHLGVNGLFTNLLGILSLADLGVGTAMVYSMYKPVAQDDRDMIIRLMNLYKLLYRYVAVIITVLGLAIYPFLDYFVKGASGVEHLHFIYLMYLANTVSSYLLSYKYSIILVNQKAYIRTIYEHISHIVQLILQILVLVYTKNFILYLAVQLIGAFTVNVLIARKADKEYPYLKEHKELPPKEIRKDITKNVMAMSMHKFGGVMVQGTDNLIMSAFVGLGSVGIYSNYKLILTNANYMLAKIYEAFTASIGNLGATENSEKVYTVYQALDFLMFLLYGYVSAGMFVMLNPFIEVVFGEKYVFSMAVVFLMVMDFYITGMRQINLRFRETMGLFWYDRFKPIFEVSINWIVSIVLVQKYEIVGILLGTIVSSLSTCFWIEPYVLMKHGIKTEWKKKLAFYFLQYGQRAVSTAAGTAASWFVCSRLPHTNFGWLVIQGIICTLIYNGIILLLYGRSKEFCYLKARILEFFHLKKANSV